MLDLRRITTWSIQVYRNLTTACHTTKTKDITLYLHCWILLENQILLQLQYIKLLWYQID